MIGVVGSLFSELTAEELAGIPGHREAFGSIELRRDRGVSWLLVREDEGLVPAAHRALDLYVQEKGLIWVKVLRKAPVERYVTGDEWELFMAFRPE